MFVFAHVLLWTVSLTILKATQDIHFDVAEVYGWGQKFLLGYGKHPPLSGWVAGLWFMGFPAADWATYALAMATVGCGMMICWHIAIRVVDRPRALLSLAMLAIYPIFNFKGFKYNADLLQLATLPLVVLAYLDAFEKPTVRSGVWLGLAGTLALMTKYWALTMIGAIGLAALIHPERIRLLRSPAPWVALATMAVTMVPHLVWLQRSDFVSLTYAGDVYSLTSRSRTLAIALGYVEHNLALLLLPIIAAAAALIWTGRKRAAISSGGFGFLSPPRAGSAHGVNLSQAKNIWLVQSIVALGPPISALVFSIYIKTDWGIPLFFLTPLALLAIPSLRVKKSAVFLTGMVWLAVTVGILCASPIIQLIQTDRNANEWTYADRSGLARQLTATWHSRFKTRWAVVVGTTEAGSPMTFYSPDHPATFTPNQEWSSGLTSLDEARMTGYIGICDPTDYRLQPCKAWMEANSGNGEHFQLTTQRHFRRKVGPAMVWEIYIRSPG